MFKIRILIAAIAVATAALPAAADPSDATSPGAVSSGDPDANSIQYRNAGYTSGYARFKNEEKELWTAPRQQPIADGSSAKGVPAGSRVENGFEYVGGESGWQLAPHKLAWRAGRFVHSDDCDHVIRTVKGPTPAELEAVKSRSSGG